MARTIPSKFELDVKMFNEIYQLGGFDTREEVLARLRVFKNMILEELDEIEDIVINIERGASRLEMLTELADLLGDLQVYCASEMVRFQIPVDAVLGIIMASNFSKLGEDGKPIKRSDGKVMKGPNYWKPEPAILKLLTEELKLRAE